MESSRPASTRIEWLDIAKVYGMFLVYYAHFVEAISEMGNEAALVQQKLIYAFHMPLFIVLSGYLARAELPGLWTFLKRQLASRILPVLFFSVLMMPVAPLIDAFSDPSDAGPTRIRARWIRDWPELCLRLAPPHQDDQVAARSHLWTLFSPEVRSTIQLGAQDTTLSEEGQQRIANAVNALLARADLYSTDLFAGQDLPDPVEEGLNKDLGGLAEDAIRRHNLTLTWWTLYPDSGFWGGASAWLHKALMTLKGYPVFNWLTWFLVCLFSVELIHFVAVRFLTDTRRIALAIPVFGVAGWFATLDVAHFGDVWFIRESVLLYAFYLLGFLLRRTGVVEQMQSLWWRLLLFAASGTVLLLTFSLNPCTENVKPVVLINLSQHGDPLYFAIAAVAGCIAVLALARLTPPVRILTVTGRYTLILMGLNEVFFKHVNWALGGALPIPPSQALIVLWCAPVAIASMAACAPAIWLLVRYLPQLAGYPRVRGPLLPNLVLSEPRN